MQMTYSIRHFHLENELSTCPLYLKEILPQCAIVKNEVNEIWSQGILTLIRTCCEAALIASTVDIKFSGHRSVMVRDASLQ